MSAPTQAQAHAAAQKIDGTGRVLKTAANGGPRYDNKMTQTGSVDPNFPTYPDYNIPVDRETDDYMSTKWAMTDDNAAGVQPHVQVGEKDIKWIRSRYDAEENARFKHFVELSIPRGTPWAREFFERIQPGWYQSKYDIITQKMELLKRFMKITLEGIQSIEDMYLLYILYTGRIKMPESIEEIIRPPQQGMDADKYTAGVFSPTRYVNTQVRISKRNRNYLANFAIPGIDTKGLNAGILPQSWNAGADTTQVQYISNLIARAGTGRPSQLNPQYGTAQ